MESLFLLIIIYMILVLASSQIPPGSPVINGPKVIVLNSKITLTCTSARGDPPPTVKWFKDDTEITNGVSTTTAGTAVTTSFTFTATKDYHLEVVECQAENGELQNPLSTAKTIEVQFSPESPVLTGPTTLTPGQQGIWTCVSVNGYPAGVMSMRNQNKNTQFTTEFTSNSVLDQQSYDATGTLIWSPVIVNNGDTICCDVTHTTTSTTPQTVCRQITVSQPIAINAPVNQYTPTLQTTVTLLCDVTQGTASQIIWIKNNVQLNIGTNSRLTGGTVATESLTITNVQQSDGGNYVCRGIDAVTGNIVNTDTINVNPFGTPPITSIPQSSYTQITGQQIILGCTVNSPNSPLQEVKWTFTNIQGQTTDPISISNSNGKYSGSSVNSPSLTINSVASTDQGVYSCKARNAVGTSTKNPTTSLTVTGSVPVVQINPSTYTATYGSQVLINCNIVSASPAVTQVYWQRSSNNQILRIDNGDQGYQGSTTSTPSLTINFVNTANAGVYTCFATNAVGTGTSNLGTVTVTGGLLSVFVTPQNQSVIHGNQQRITCTVSGTPSAQNIAWLFTAAGSSQQTLLNTRNSQKYSFGTTQDPFLTVLNFQPSDSGTYVCRATNAAGSTSSNPGSTLLYSTAPTTYVEPRQYTATVGDASFQIQCLVTATPGATSWYWTFQPVGGSQQTIAQGTNDNQHTVDNSGTNPYLTVKSIALNEAGIYTCYATNSAGTSDGANNPSSRHTLTVIGGLLSVFVTPQNQSVIHGNQQKITCTVSGTPSAQNIAWLFTAAGSSQQTQLNTGNSQKYSLGTTQDPFLTVLNFQPSDSGTYVCRATHAAGSTSSNPGSTLLYITAPTTYVEPRQYTATVGDASFQIQCLVTATPGATSWYWTFQPVGGSQQTIAQGTNDNQHTVDNSGTNPYLTVKSIALNEAGIYTCYATNSAGTSDGANNPSSRHTLTVIGGLLSVFVTPQNQSVIHGNQQRITCTVSGTPSAQNIAWLFTAAGSSQQTQLNTGNSQIYSLGTTQDPFLTVLNFQPSDSGTYVCRATNAAGSTSSNPGSTLLYITAPTTYVEPRQYTATVGDASFQIQCLVTATPGATSWYWTFQPVGGSQQTIAQGTNDNQHTVDNSGTNPYLTVKSIALNEAGIYTCYATNSAGTSDGANNPSSRHTLTVIGGDLDITVSLTTYSAITGDSIVTILCKINGTAPAIAWDWTKTPIAGGNSEIISQGTNNARRQVINSATKPNLNIYSITEDDEGIYRCRANNGKQQYISEPIILKVQEASLRKVPGEPQTNNVLEVEEGRTVMLTCSSTGGNPAPSVVWLRDSMLISTGTNSSIVGNVTTTTLTFVTTAYDNREVYECQVDNGFLQRPLVKTTYLLFSSSNKPPGQPIITGIQRYDLGDTVTLSCSSTGGNPLPTVNWLRDDNIITTGISRFSGSGVTSITLTFVAGLEEHLEVFECQAHNNYLQNPLASTTYIELYFAPRVPTLTGPSFLISGSSGKWTCSSANGYPAPSLSMRIQDRQYTNEITVVQSYDIIDKSYSVAGTLNLVPSTDKTGQDLCCDVSYLFDNNEPQSTCLQLTINVLVLFVLLVVMIRYIIGREKGKDNANSKYVSQQAAFSNQQDNADISTHRDRGRDFEGLSSNRREIYNASHDNVEYSHYSTIPADHVFVDPNHTHPSILKQNSTNLQQDTTYLEPEHYILLTPDNVYLEPDQTYFQPISGNSMTSTT